MKELRVGRKSFQQQQAKLSFIHYLAAPCLYAQFAQASLHLHDFQSRTQKQAKAA